MQKNPSWNKQALLAGALFVLGTTAYWLEFKQKPQKEAQEEQSKKVFNLKDVSVKAMRLTDAGGKTFELLCLDTAQCKPGDNSKWELAQPTKLKADDSNANALVSALNNLAINETVDLKDETPEKRAALLKDYGLDPQARGLPNARRVEVETAAGKTALYLGNSHPIGDTLFALGGGADGKIDENKVYLVPTYFKANLDHDLTYWRDKKLMTASTHEVESFSLVSSKANINGERKDGQWALKPSSGDGYPGDIENIDNLVTAATYLSAKAFVADKKDSAEAKAALKGTRQVLSLTLQQEKGSNAAKPAPITLALFEKADASAPKKPAKPAKGAPPADAKPATKLYATVSNLDPVYELEPTSLDRLNKLPRDLRLAKLITSMERFTTKRIEFTGKALGAEPLILKNENGKWTTEGDKTETDGDKVQSFLDRLSGNRISDFVASAPSGESDGTAVKLIGEKGDLLRHLAFWKNGGKLYSRDLKPEAAKKPGAAKDAVVVDVAVGEDLPKGRDAFVKKAPPPPAAPPAPGGPGAPIPPPPPGAPGGNIGGPAGGPPEPGRELVPVPHGDPGKH